MPIRADAGCFGIMHLCNRITANSVVKNLGNLKLNVIAETLSSCSASRKFNGLYDLRAVSSKVVRGSNP